MDLYLDAGLLTDKNSAHKYLADLFEFPDYYGNNLDALNDCLSVMGDVTLYILNADKAGEYYNRVLPIIQKNIHTIIE